MATPSPQPAPKRRRPPRWFKVTVVTALVLANLVALGVFWAVRTGSNFFASAQSDSDVSEVLDAKSGNDLTFLLVGSDSRDGLDDLENFGNFSGARADVIMLVRVGGSSSTIQMLSIPRDLWVDIPGSSANRINAAYAVGGSRRLVETIQKNLNLQINHYVEIDFVGFQGLIDEMGGISMTFEYPARDLMSGLDVPAGSQTLDGQTALAYARSRHYQENRNGSWTYVEANDLGRTARQQEVMRAIFSELKTPSSIADAGAITSALAKYVKVDSRLAGSSVASLMWDFRGALTGNMNGATLPVTGRNIGGRSVVVFKEPEAGEMLANFRAGRSLASEVLRLQVLNGNGVSGSAGDMSETLAGAGFAVGRIGDASNKDYSTTTVIVPSGSSNGSLILSAIGFGQVVVGNVDSGYDAIVIVGADAR